MTLHLRIKFPLALLLLLLLGGCAAVAPPAAHQELTAYGVEGAAAPIAEQAPIFVVENGGEPANRIGTPVARRNGSGEEEVVVTADTATIYVEERPFRTDKGAYTNLIYRVHFPEIPFSLLPFHLGWGDNIGLIVVVTVDGEGKPLLYTTVQTCGCYLAFIPTSFLPVEALPAGWNQERQYVYGELLPGLLDFNCRRPEQKVVQIFLRNATHRVREIRLADRNDLQDSPIVPATLSPLAALEHLPLPDGGTTSFYQTSGSGSGYVKGSHKPWELLLMSWWTLDGRIGQDKKLGTDREDGPLFYTSLKPWEREASDLRDFPAFLRYWGWNL